MENNTKNDGLDNALKIFENSAKNVKGYKKFLKANKISPQLIIKKRDIKSIPIMDKSNYLLAFELSDLVPFSKFPPIFSASSGSSGKPYYWPRGDKQEARGARIHRTILKDIFKINKKSTLAIVCFSMGNWVAGTYTLSSLREISKDKDTNLSIITPGIDKSDVIQILKNFAGNFDSIILFGYPPFLMDVVLEAKESNVDFKKLNLNFVFAGENFSERWRDLIFKYAEVPNNLNRSVSIYGTADAGMIGNENPFTILIRKLASKNKKLCLELLGNNSFVPTVVSYVPTETYFETVNGEIIFTIDSGIPLIRYNIKDRGTLMSHKEALSIIKKNGLSKYITNDVKKWKTPILILKGRNDVSITFYGLNIYPENIKAGLEDSKISSFVTGKHIITKDQTKDYTEQRLKIIVELKLNVLPSNDLKKIIGDTIFQKLIELNTEYRKLFNSIKEKAIPEISILENGNEIFVIKKAKHSWCIK